MKEMEIEALKNRWSELEKQLEQNKSLNERIIKEMIDRKAGKIDTAINRLLFRDIYALVFMLVMFACLLYLFQPLTITLVTGYVLFAASQILIKKLQLPNFVYWLEIVALVVISLILYF